MLCMVKNINTYLCDLYVYIISVICHIHVLLCLRVKMCCKVTRVHNMNLQQQDDDLRQYGGHALAESQWRLLSL